MGEHRNWGFEASTSRHGGTETAAKLPWKEKERGEEWPGQGSAPLRARNQQVTRAPRKERSRQMIGGAMMQAYPIRRRTAIAASSSYKSLSNSPSPSFFNFKATAATNPSLVNYGAVTATLANKSIGNTPISLVKLRSQWQHAVVLWFPDKGDA